MSSKDITSDYEMNRWHIVRLCRERCIEEGFSDNAFRECVDKCIKDSIGE